MKKKNEIWVFIEVRNGKPADVSLELLSKGYKLAATTGSTLKSIVIGENVKHIAEESFNIGVSESILVDAPEAGEIFSDSSLFKNNECIDC